MLHTTNCRTHRQAGRHHCWQPNPLDATQASTLGRGSAPGHQRARLLRRSVPPGLISHMSGHWQPSKWVPASDDALQHTPPVGSPSPPIRAFFVRDQPLRALSWSERLKAARPDGFCLKALQSGPTRELLGTGQPPSARPPVARSAHLMPEESAKSLRKSVKLGSSSLNESLSECLRKRLSCLLNESACCITGGRADPPVPGPRSIGEPACGCSMRMGPPCPPPLPRSSDWRIDTDSIADGDPGTVTRSTGLAASMPRANSSSMSTACGGDGGDAATVSVWYAASACWCITCSRGDDGDAQSAPSGRARGMWRPRLSWWYSSIRELPRRVANGLSMPTAGSCDGAPGTPTMDAGGGGPEGTDPRGRLHVASSFNSPPSSNMPQPDGGAECSV
mmetsp:Transcript_39172/g.116511  ORF Transcript_39172/g.116511 Transcript_39172/m.116511 type:complete len:392 (+) Transcript_39172:1950-3125(+)